MLQQKEQWIIDDNSAFIPLAKWQETVNLMANIFGAPAGFIVQFTENGTCQIVMANQSGNHPYEAGAIIDSSADIFCRKVVNQCQPLYERHASSNPEWNNNPEVHNDGFNSYLGYPVRWPDGTVFGTICVMDYCETDYSDMYVQLMDQFRHFIEADLKLKEKYLQVEQMSYRDSLTKLYNRRGFFNYAQRLINLSHRLDIPVGLIFLDVDGLKSINDQYGHESGDVVLEVVGSSIAEVVRESDIAARLGGDEFVLLAQMDHDNDLLTLQTRLDQILSKNSALLSKPYDAKVSMGGELFHADKEVSVEMMIGLADSCMYKQKLHS